MSRLSASTPTTIRTGARHWYFSDGEAARKSVSARHSALPARDQIWFTEKDEAGATTLYPLSDFHPKGDEAIGRRYLQGRYGGVPVLDPAGFRKAAESNGS